MNSTFSTSQPLRKGPHTADIALDRVVVLLLAGGTGGRLGPLTRHRAKPAMPLAATHRLIDVALSQCRNSGIENVWVVTQYDPHQLTEHLANGRPWDLDRTVGGLRLLPPWQAHQADRAEATGPTGGFAQGNADALLRHLRAIREADPTHILVLSSDHLYRMDLRPLLRAHQATQAEVTMGLVPAPPDASRYGLAAFDEAKPNPSPGETARVARFEYKPEQPTAPFASMEVFCYTASALYEVLEQLAESPAPPRDATDGDGDSNGETAKPNLGDFGHHLLPRFVERGRAYGFHHGGYWRDLGTIDSYWQAHMDVIDKAHEDLDLGDACWPVRTNSFRTDFLMGASVRGSGARLLDCIAAPGALVQGRAQRSFIGYGAVIEAGAELEECVVLDRARVKAGVKLRRAIIEEGFEATPANTADLQSSEEHQVAVLSQHDES